MARIPKWIAGAERKPRADKGRPRGKRTNNAYVSVTLPVSLVDAVHERRPGALNAVASEALAAAYGDPLDDTWRTVPKRARGKGRQSVELARLALPAVWVAWMATQKRNSRSDLITHALYYWLFL